MHAASPRAVVIDTNVVLDLLVFDDPSVQPLRAALADGRLCWRVLPGMREELARVLAYPRVASSLCARALAPDAVLAAFDAASRMAAPVPAAPVRCTDPDDQPFLDLALAHGALLATKDKAVLATRKRMAAHGVDIWQPFVTKASAALDLMPVIGA
ncbi:putative toxin-antitoxin system toxin component, PIN family [Pseudorhodoferax sp. Leaf267]|uniref:PIN domain-containing protein n=1 Tax=Pseudorhodoferax sp. Leaf267 TaxID=1736316 RepID=UPI0009EABC5B|nr:PIN domain-containing protein [Pseudorhodoferax sp. Leaf267]